MKTVTDFTYTAAGLPVIDGRQYPKTPRFKCFRAGRDMTPHARYRSGGRVEVACWDAEYQYSTVWTPRTNRWAAWRRTRVA